MSLRVEADTLREELDQIIAILTKWKEKLSGGIPGDEIPADPIGQEVFQVQLRGEFWLCAERLNALVEVLE